MRLAILSLTVMLSIVLSSCKKNDPQPSATHQLMVNTWQIQSYTAESLVDNKSVIIYSRGNPNNALDASSYQLQFNADGTAISYYDNQSINCTWQLITNETQLELSPLSSAKEVYNLGGVSASALTLSYFLYSTTTNPGQGVLLGIIQNLGLDSSKGVKITYTFKPL
ncbi:hypothetical protein [Spirosoma koreense]